MIVFDRRQATEVFREAEAMRQADRGKDQVTDGDRLDWLEAHDGIIDQWLEGPPGTRWEVYGAGVGAFGDTLRAAIDSAMVRSRDTGRKA